MDRLTTNTNLNANTNARRGIALLMASAIAGLLWDQFGPSAPFLASAILATLALVFWVLRSSSRSNL